MKQRQATGSRLPRHRPGGAARGGGSSCLVCSRGRITPLPSLCLRARGGSEESDYETSSMKDSVKTSSFHVSSCDLGLAHRHRRCKAQCPLLRPPIMYHTPASRSSRSLNLMQETIPALSQRDQVVLDAISREYQQRKDQARQDYKMRFQIGRGSGAAGAAAERSELLPRFEAVFTGDKIELTEDCRTIHKSNWSIVHGRVLGLDRKIWYEDKEENIPYGYYAPSTFVFGRASSQRERYSFLIREINGGSFFLGFLEYPFKPVQQWPYFFDTRAWMLADGGNVFRTGPEVGGEGYYDSPQDELPSLGRNFAIETGFEALTELLRRELVGQYPDVTTPGIWTFGEGSVVSLEIDREKKELCFQVNDAPPFTLRNVSSSALPFVTLLYPNDTVSLLSPSEEEFFRAKWKSKRRGPEDPDYWVWDWERWRPSDGGLMLKDGKWVEDPTKKNRWEADQTKGGE
eukprot:545362-Hanusia_phi.AAC.1